MFNDYDFYFNIALIGATSVGKTSILCTYLDGVLDHKSKTTIGYDFRMNQLALEGKRIKLQIFDTAGQQRYRSLASSYLKNAHAIFLVFDVKQPKSFQQLTKIWIKIAQNNSKQGTLLIVLANKCDKQQQGPTQEQIHILQTSALTGQNINLAFQQCALSLIQQSRPAQLLQTSLVVLGSKPQVLNKKRCC